MNRITFFKINQNSENKITNFKVEILIKVNKKNQFLELISNERKTAIYDENNTFLGSIEPFLEGYTSLQEVLENISDFSMRFEHKASKFRKFSVVIIDDILESNVLAIPIEIPTVKEKERIYSVILSASLNNENNIEFKLSNAFDITNNNLQEDNEIPITLPENLHSTLLTTYSKYISDYIEFLNVVSLNSNN